VRQTINGMDINAANNGIEEKQQNGSENVPPPPSRGETKKTKLAEEQMETVSKATGASKFASFSNCLECSDLYLSILVSNICLFLFVTF
jgi:hypothetical protein